MYVRCDVSKEVCVLKNVSVWHTALLSGCMSLDMKGCSLLVSTLVSNLQSVFNSEMGL